jgi:hypothetical protein
MKNVLLAAALILIAAAADATCIKCDQSTGYRCYMSIYGTKANCDSPSDAGCFTWGACSGGSECDFGCVFDPVALARPTDDLLVASVTITSPQPENTKSTAPKQLNG